MMRVLIVGAGGVGSAVARTVARLDLFERVVMADYDEERARRAIAGGGGRFAAFKLDARDEQAIAELIRTERCDAVLNALDPRFVMPVFRAALSAGSPTSTWRCRCPARTRRIRTGNRESNWVTSSSHSPGNGSAAGFWPCAAWGWSRGCRTCSPATRQTGCLRPSTRWASATAQTWWSRV